MTEYAQLKLEDEIDIVQFSDSGFSWEEIFDTKLSGQQRPSGVRIYSGKTVHFSEDVMSTNKYNIFFTNWRLFLIYQKNTDYMFPKDPIIREDFPKKMTRGA